MLDFVEKLMPRDFVPLTYRIVYLAALMWTGVGLKVCWASMDVMVDRSGRVVFDSQRSEPTKLCICCLRGIVAT